MSGPAEGASLRFDDLIATYVDDPDRVERQWLEDDVATALRRPDVQVVLIVGEPGAGKSGAMAGVARHHPDWLRYFIRTDSTTPLAGGDATAFLLRIGHQLAAASPDLFDLDQLEIVVEQRVDHAQGASVVGAQIEELQVSPFRRTAIQVQQSVGSTDSSVIGLEVLRAAVEPRLMEPAVLQYLALWDPAAVLARTSPDAQVVVLVDALDETAGLRGITSVLDWLEACPQLPGNVRIVVSSRPSSRLDVLRGKAGVVEISIDTGSAQVAEDVRTYASALFAAPELAGSVLVPDPPAAVEALVGAADGNFAYLNAYARALRAAVVDDDAVTVAALLNRTTIPSGLRSLYAFFLAKVRTEISRLGNLDGPKSDEIPAWEGAGQRMLGVLAVSFEAVSLDQLVSYGAVRCWPQQAGNVLDRLVPFLDRFGDRWRLFHASLAEFLVEPGSGTAGPAVDANEVHQRILHRCRGEAQAWADVDWTQVDDYGLRHVVDHLVAAPGDEEPAAVITRGLREASLDRFRTDAIFDRTVGVIAAHDAATTDLSDALADTIFVELVRLALRSRGRRTDPAVLGLMARLGRVDEALDRADILRSGQHQMASLVAIRVNTPSDRRELLGGHDGADRLVTAALLVPTNESIFAGLERREALRIAAQALAPFDLDGALALLVGDEDGERDKAIRAAAVTRPIADAVVLLDRLHGLRAEVALDLADRADAPERDALLTAAAAGVDDAEESERIVLRARLAVAGIGDVEDVDAGIRTSLACGGDRFTNLEPLVRAIAVIADTDRARAQDLLHVASSVTAESSTVNGLEAAVKLWARWGDVARTNAVADAMLGYYRGLGWYGPASDIARLAVIVETVDPVRGRALVSEALQLTEQALADSDEFGRGEMTATSVVSALLDAHPELAIAVAERVGGAWVPGGPWNSVGSRSTALALRGIAMADTDPGAAAELLGRCLSDETSHFDLGRPDPTLVRGGLFRPATDADDPAPSDDTVDTQNLGRIVNFLTYLQNSVNYWLSARDWRYFASPADVLRAVRAAPNAAGAITSWAAAVAAAVPALAADDPDAAAAVVGQLTDPAEQVIALSCLYEALANVDDPRAPRMRTEIVRRSHALPRYQPELPLEPVPQGPILRYLDPSARARFESAVRLGRADGTPAADVLLPDDQPYLIATLELQLIDESLMWLWERGAEGVDVEPLLASLADRIDPLQADLAKSTLAAILGYFGHPSGPAATAAITTPWLRTQAQILAAIGADDFDQILAAAANDLDPLHRVGIAGRAIELEQAAATPNTKVVMQLLEWADAGLRTGDVMANTFGAAELAVVVGELRPGLVGSALERNGDLANPYLRSDALAALLEPAMLSGDAATVRTVARVIVREGWPVLTDALRRGAEVLVGAGGAAALERVHRALTAAQAVVGSQPHEDGAIDGVHPGKTVPWLALLLAPPPDDTDYLAGFLRPEDLPGMRRVQDARRKGPDPDDDAFPRLQGIHAGFAVWLAEFTDTVWRVVDVRATFPDDASASTYLHARLDDLSEGNPLVAGAPSVGADCHVFGGTRLVTGTDVQMTMYFYVFRVGSTVVKLFAAQGVQSQQPLTPEALAVSARTIVTLVASRGGR